MSPNEPRATVENVGEPRNSSTHLALMCVEKKSWRVEMRTAHVLAVAAALTSSAILSLPANSAEVCDQNCIGPLCGENCTRTPDVTVGRGVREPDVTIEERRRVREPGVEIRRERRPGVDVEINR
jgi:hypothetical protein